MVRQSYLSLGSLHRRQGPALACRTKFRYILPLLTWLLVGARSSAGEHYVDIVGVTGSIPVAPTISFKHLGDIWPWEEAQDGSLVSK